MKTYRIEGVEKSLIKKSKKKKKKKKVKSLDVTSIEAGILSSPISVTGIDSQFEHEQIDGQMEDVSNEVETVDEISKFIGNHHSDEDDFNFQDEQIDDHEVMMLEKDIEENSSVGEKKQMQRQTVLEVKVDRLEKNLTSFAKDLKEIKSLLNIRSKSSRSKVGIVAYCEDACVFPLLPKFRLKLVPQVKKMEIDVNVHDYKKQLVQKMSLIGGRTVKEIVINIFKKMFTAKLKTKFTWTGASKTGPKEAFRDFEGIISSIQIAVSAHYDCTIADIENECKLRLKQAQKDYDRQKLKKKRDKERLEKERLANLSEQDEV